MKIIALVTALMLFVSCGSSSVKFNDIAKDAKEVRPVIPGSAFPKAMVKNADGKVVDLGEELKGKKTVLVFYRGGWCPYCNKQLQGLRKIEKKLKRMGYQIVGISPDRPAKLKEAVSKNKLSYKIYSDDMVNAARAFGLAFQVTEELNQVYLGYGINLKDASGQEHLVLPVPAVYIIGEDLKINFSYANPDYKSRLKEKLILAAAKEYK